MHRPIGAHSQTASDGRHFRVTECNLSKVANCSFLTSVLGRSKKRRDDGTTGQMTGHLAARGSASHYMACRKATRQATELTTV